MDEVVRPPGVPPRAFMSRRSWMIGIVLGLLTLAAGLWGYFADDSGNQSPLEAISYFWLPLLVLAVVALSLGRRPVAILCAVGLLDVEAALLGAGPQISLPFIVAVPLIGVAVTARMVPASRLMIPYVGAWVASSVGVTLAVLMITDSAASSTIVVIPAFMFVDAVALAMLWRLDRGRLRAIDAAGAAEARVRDLLDGVDLVGVHIGPDSHIDYINDFALRLTGWTREEVLGKDWWDTFATPDRRDEARARWVEIMAGRYVMEHQRESAIMTRSGEVLLIRWSHVTRHDPDGQVAGVASLGEDITAIRAAEDAAGRGAEMLSKLVVRSPLPTIVLSLDMDVQLWNPAAAELVGWTEIGRAHV